MDTSPGPIDEEARRDFEKARRGYSSAHLGDFVPSAGDERRASTLEELICIELEFAWKAWSPGRAIPELRPWTERYAADLDPSAVARLVEEEALLRGIHFREEEADPSGSRYELLEEIGRGTFARVFRARDPRLGRLVAVKVLRAEYLADQRMRERFQREGRSAAKLYHPGIVPVHEVGQEEGRPFIVTELIEGPTLEERLVASPPTPRQIAAWLAGLADALDYAHGCGVVHRDVKPENVLTTTDGELLISDFGLAFQEETESGLTRHGDLLGTPAYMSPEQARGEGQVDARSDIYSLGVILYRALCGHLPFEGSWSSILRRVVEEEPIPPHRRATGVSRELETIGQCAMAKEPERRYQSAHEMAADLRRFLAHEPIQARRPNLAQSLFLWCRRNPALAMTIAVGISLLVLVSSLGFRGILRERDEAQANLRRALVGEARALLEAQTTDWWRKGMANIERARGFESSEAELGELRELASEFMATASPAFHQRGRWSGGEGPVRCVAVDPLGRYGACGWEDGTLVLLELSEGRQLSCRPFPAAVTELAFHSRGFLLVGTEDSAEVHTIALPDRTDSPGSSLTSAFVRSFGEPITALDCSPVDDRLALGLESGAMVLLDEWSEVSPARPLQAGGAMAHEIAFGPDGLLFLSCHEHGDVVLWDAQAREAIDLCSVGEPVGGGAVDTSGRMVVAIPSWYGVMRRDPETGKDERLLGAQKHNGTTTVARCGGAWTFSSARDGSLKAWDGALRITATATVDRASLVRFDVDSAGRMVLAGYSDGELVLWEFGEPSERVFIRADHTLAWRPGKRLVAYGLERSFAEGLELRPHDDRIFREPAITSLVTIGDDGAFACGFASNVSAGHCSFEEGRIAVVDPDGGVRRWTAFPRHGVSALAVDEPRAQLASVSTGGVVKVWSLSGAGREEPSPLAEVEVPVSNPRLLRWIGSEGRLLVASEKDLLLVTPEAGATSIERLPWSGPAALHGDWLAVGDARGGVEVYELESHRNLARLGPLGAPVSILYWHAPTGLLLAASTEGELVSWRAPSFEPGPSWSLRARGARWLRLDRRARTLAAGGHGRFSPTLFSFESGEPLVWIRDVQTNVGGFAKDDTELLLADHGGSVEAVTLAEVETFLSEDVQAGATLTEPTARPYDRTRPRLAGSHSRIVWGLAASPDGNHVASCAHDGTVNLWTGADCLTLDWSVAGHDDVAWSVAFDHDSSRVASTSLDVKIWRVADGAEELHLEGHERLTTGAVFLRSRPLLVTCALDGTVRVWDLEDGSLLAEPYDSTAPFHGLALDPTGRWLAVASGDSTVLLWDRIEEGDSTRGPDHILPRAGNPVWAVAFDPTGETLAVAEQEGGVTLWDTTDWRFLTRLRCGTRQLRAVTFSDDGSLLAVGSYGYKGIVWDLPEVRRSLGEMGLDW